MVVKFRRSCCANTVFHMNAGARSGKPIIPGEGKVMRLDAGRSSGLRKLELAEYRRTSKAEMSVSARAGSQREVARQRGSSSWRA